MWRFPPKSFFLNTWSTYVISREYARTDVLFVTIINMYNLRVTFKNLDMHNDVKII